MIDIINKRANEQPDKIFIYYNNASITYQEFNYMVLNLVDYMNEIDEHYIGIQINHKIKSPPARTRFQEAREPQPLQARRNPTPPEPQSLRKVTGIKHKTTLDDGRKHNMALGSPPAPGFAPGTFSSIFFADRNAAQCFRCWIK